MIFTYDEQGSEEWLRSRLGKPSASCFGKLITRNGAPSASADNYINGLIYELLSNEIPQGFTSEAMARGTELEPEARDNYEFITGNEVDEVGFIMDENESYGCSPDGLIGQDGGIEIKCPLGATMVKYLRNPDQLVKNYWQQIQGCMWITERKWWDAFAYHPNTPHVLVRVERDEDYISKLEEQVISACITINQEVEKNQ